jgi:hypothetical protein
MLEQSQVGGCFYCLAIFPASEVIDWVGEEQAASGDLTKGDSALCPRCGIDAVLPSSAVSTLSPELLAQMRAFWF